MPKEEKKEKKEKKEKREAEEEVVEKTPKKAKVEAAEDDEQAKGGIEDEERIKVSERGCREREDRTANWASIYTSGSRAEGWLD